MRRLVEAKVEPGKRNPLPEKIAITAANAALAEALCEAFAALGIDAQIVDDGGIPSGDLIVLTEGTVIAYSALERHWGLLNLCQSLREEDASIVMLGYHDTRELSALSGLRGLSRTLRQEWPQTQINTIEFSASCCADEIAQALLEGPSEGCLSNGQLSDMIVTDDALTLPGPSQVHDAGNWLITGGARGVTATCTIELARHIGAGKFFLAGRSDVVEWPANVPECDSLPALRGLLITAAKDRGEHPRPAEIDKQARALLAGREVRNTLSALSQHGVEAHYVKLDVSDRADVQAKLTELTKQHGAFTGLVHGAGVLADKLAIKKTEADVASVFAPKVDGLLNILTGLDLTALTHCGLFSSAAAVFGNPGQSDYAMANAWLNAVAQHLWAAKSQLQVKSFCWGPWAGGMVDDTLAAHFVARGIPLIGLQEGAEIFAHHLLYGDRDSVNLLIGDRWQS